MLNDSQLNVISRIYDNRRNAAWRLKDARTDELYEANPRIKEIDEEISSGSLSAGRMALKGDNSALEVLKAKNDSLIEEKKALIKACGFPEDYLENIYYCPLCKDRGHVDNVRCTCYNKTVINEFYLDKNRLELLTRENFRTFDTNLYSRESVDPESGVDYYSLVQDNLIEAINFASEFKTNYKNLLITGNAGTGKTFLANCIAKKLIDSGISVLYLSSADFFELCKRFRVAQNEEYHTAKAELGFVLSAECLIIDDLGTEPGTSFTNSQLFDCLEKRHLAKLPTVITTNLSKEDLGSRYSDRIRSRLMANFKYLKMPGDDNRLKNKM